MPIEFDPSKNEANLRKHGIGFEAVERFDWDTAVEFEDDRFRYDEPRTTAVGFIGNRLYVLTYTVRGDVTRPISLRSAIPRERKMYHDQA